VADDWRIRITFPSQPGMRGKSSLRTVVDDLHSHLGDDVPVSSGRAHIFVYAATAGAAREADEVARVVLAQHNLSGEFRLEHWDPPEEAWLDAPADPPDDDAAQRTAHEHQQDQERERSAATGLAAWQVRVELASRQDVTALAERLASEGWPVVRRRRYLVAGANCEDDANGLAQQIQGYGHPGTTIRVQRSDTAASMPQDWGVF
jgi:hypothetical protein